MKSAGPSGRTSLSPSKEVISQLLTEPNVAALLLRQWRTSVERTMHVDWRALRSGTVEKSTTVKHAPGSLLEKMSNAIDTLNEYRKGKEMANKPGVGNAIYPDKYSDFDPLGREGPRRPLSKEITIADVVALAQAGVKMDVNDVTRLLESPAIYQNPPSTHPLDMSLEDRIVHRWQSTMIQSSPETFGSSDRTFRTRDPSGMQIMPFVIGKVITHGDKQYVFVQKPGNAPLIIEDDCALFPSDNLMNSLRLMDKNLPDAPQGNMSGGVAGGGMGGTTGEATPTSAMTQRFQNAKQAMTATARK